VVSRLSRLVDALCEALASFDPALWSGEDCAVLAARLARTAKACETASARSAARAAECGRVGAAPAVFLARMGGCTTGAARSALATVQSVVACPRTEVALRCGEVSLAQAAEIASVPEHEAELLDLARSTDLRAVKDAARKHRLAAIDPEELYAKQCAAREFVHWKDELGMTRFRGALPPDVGVPFVNRLDAQTDREWRTAKRAGKVDARAAHAADALVRMTENGRAARPIGTDLVITVYLRAYRRGHAEAGECCHIVGDGPIPVHVVRAMANDAFLKVVLHDGVAIHTVAHLGRKRPAHLDTALRLGAPPDFDGAVCTEPHCDRTYHLQWDHKDPFANGGKTSFGNLQPYCSPHHVEKTERDRRAGLLGGDRKTRGP
jgi:hypothetical protein